MSDLDILIEQMVLDIWAQAYQLDDQRLGMFLDWLITHSFEMKRSLGNNIDTDPVALRGLVMQACIQSALKSWLQSLPGQGVLWEYKTVLAEIIWWRDLDPVSLKMILGSELEK